MMMFTTSATDPTTNFIVLSRRLSMLIRPTPKNDCRSFSSPIDAQCDVILNSSVALKADRLMLIPKWPSPSVSPVIYHGLRIRPPVVKMFVMFCIIFYVVPIGVWSAEPPEGIEPTPHRW